MGLIIRWLANTLALFIAVTILGSHFHYRSFVTLLVAALVLGLLNALMLEITARLVRGFRIDTFGWAIVGAIVLGLVSLVTNRIGRDSRRRE